ncbi:hypothetical protein DFS34DRAFT_611528 [Phlyctochytrium arcticum]|nr:hypothetical protein DFS34DRAFT_611528 [Phlyctochytrium arcticum]
MSEDPENLYCGRHSTHCPTAQGARATVQKPSLSLPPNIPVIMAKAGNKEANFEELIAKSEQLAVAKGRLATTAGVQKARPAAHDCMPVATMAPASVTQPPGAATGTQVSYYWVPVPAMFHGFKPAPVLTPTGHRRASVHSHGMIGPTSTGARHQAHPYYPVASHMRRPSSNAIPPPVFVRRFSAPAPYVPMAMIPQPHANIPQSASDATGHAAYARPNFPTRRYSLASPYMTGGPYLFAYQPMASAIPTAPAAEHPCTSTFRPPSGTVPALTRPYGPVRAYSHGRVPVCTPVVPTRVASSAPILSTMEGENRGSRRASGVGGFMRKAHPSESVSHGNHHQEEENSGPVTSGPPSAVDLSSNTSDLSFVTSQGPASQALVTSEKVLVEGVQLVETDSCWTLQATFPGFNVNDICVLLIHDPMSKELAAANPDDPLILPVSAAKGDGVGNCALYLEAMHINLRQTDEGQNCKTVTSAQSIVPLGSCPAMVGSLDVTEMAKGSGTIEVRLSKKMIPK